MSKQSFYTLVGTILIASVLALCTFGCQERFHQTLTPPKYQMGDAVYVLPDSMLGMVVNVSTKHKYYSVSYRDMEGRRHVETFIQEFELVPAAEE